MAVTIDVRGVSKKYRIGAEVKPYLTITDSLRRMINFSRKQNGSIWALDDVSFSLGEGESLGVVGRNGAGKSTLLKILSRITLPTRGRVLVWGRVASLLEVGTGFHLELTGRENIFLNGSILGMKRNEIRSRFDEMVDFSGVEKFLDTPIKHYSSGMQLRLAFAVAAHLDPEILLVDEVLAVGDAEFQNKCLGKMRQVTGEGRTVVFVSHNMTALQNLCRKGIWLTDGKITAEGGIGEVISRYLSSVTRTGSVSPGSEVELHQGITLNRFAVMPNAVVSCAPAEFVMEFTSRSQVRLDDLSVIIENLMGMRVGILDLRTPAGPRVMNAGGRLELKGRISSVQLVEGEYRVGIFLNANNEHCTYTDIISLVVSSRSYEGKVLPYPAVNRGLVELGYTLES